MTVHLSYQDTYEVPPLSAFQIRNRLEFLTAKGKELSQHDFKVLELRERGGLFRCITRMQLEVVLPGWAKRLYKPRNTITQYELWHPPAVDGTRRYDIVAEIASVPVKIDGFGLVSPSQRGCQFHLELDVSSKVWMIGPKLEAFVAEQVDHNCVGELQFGQAWLAGFANHQSELRSPALGLMRPMGLDHDRAW